MKKVYFFEFWQYAPHLETAFELARKHLDAGDEVFFYFGGHDVTFGRHVYRRESSVLVRWGLKHLPERSGSKLLRCDKFHFYPHMDLPAISRSWRLQDTGSVERLLDVKYGQYNAGLSVVSSLISETRSSNPNLEQYRSQVNRMLDDGARVYDFVRDVLQRGAPDLVYVFNGRFYQCRAVLDAANSLAVPVLIHERGSSKDRYSVRGFMPHDRMKLQEELIAHWSARDSGSAAQAVAHSFFQERRRGVEQYWKSFTSEQMEGSIPDLPDDKRIVSYFSSSDDEYVAIGDIYKWDYWKGQYEAVLDLVDLCASDPDTQLVIRIHPHLQEKSEYDRQKWMALSRFPGVIIVPPDSKVDSYALVEASDIVVVAGSTIGIESVYWETPAICLGPSIYSELGATYQPRGKEELKALLAQSGLEANRESTLSYGYYMSTFGEEFEFYKASSLAAGHFMGVDLNYVHPVVRFARIVRRLFDGLFRKEGKPAIEQGKL